MAWLLVLTILITAMLAIEGIGAERRFSRSLPPPEPREWEQKLLDQLNLGRAR
ncbi:MAG TPA: hypothetical protein VIA98_02845 [Allosphingosinicella sp.]|jgi:hypothetical protein